MSFSRSIPYVDAEPRVTGRVTFTSNLTLPGMLHAAVLRSPYAHARLVAIDPTAAEALRGVAAVLTRDDLIGSSEVNTHFGPILRDQPVVAIDRVRFVGEPVAAVAAIDRETAEHAASLIEATYEELPAVFTIEEALAPGAPLLYDPPLGRDQGRTPVYLREVDGTNVCNTFEVIRGDVAAGFAAADYIFEDVFETPAQQHVPLETHVSVAEVHDREVTVWSSTQTPYVIRAQLAELFNLPQNRVHVKVATLGGGYGGKTQPKLEPLTAVLAWKAGAPVKLSLSRAEEFVTITKHASTIRLRTGVRADGEIVAKECQMYWNGGAYADRSPTVAEAAALIATGPYRAPQVKVTSTAVYTNRPPAGAFRGFGSAQAAWAYESQMDMIAERLGLDPLELRRRNLLRAGDTYATGETLHDIAFEALLDDVARAIDWGRASAPAGPGRARGKGLAITLKAMITPSTATAMLRLNADGSCMLLTSTVEMGQGSATALTQIAADALGLPYDQVTVVQPDTDVTPFDLSTNSSRSTFAMGEAVMRAAADAVRQARTAAAELLQIDADQLEASEGGVYDRRSGRGLSYGEIVRKARLGNIVGMGTHRTEGELDPHTGQGIGSTHWHHAASGAEVEIDRETGVVSVLKLHTAIYSGRSINPVNVELQTEGNMTFGLGKALLEELVFDHGQIVNANMSDYLIPSFRDMPSDATVRIYENPDPAGEVHGVGETGLPPIAPAIGNALYHATGVRIQSLPITPEKVLQALTGSPEARPDQVAAERATALAQAEAGIGERA